MAQVATPVTLHASPTYMRLKRVLDAYVATCALLAFAPVILTIVWLIRRDSPGPGLFRQTRAGRGGRPFTLYKFRTMRSDVDPYGDSPESGTDPRITRLGRFLRETSLDELPQLINVVRGEMSLVGPRPLLMQQIPEWNERQRGRLLVPPGLTGLAQVHGRGSVPIEDKLEMDVAYVESVSLRTDAEIVWKTFRTVLSRSDLYQIEYSRTRKRFKSADAGAS